ncbi:hypothetical protein A4G18_00665 [Pasteurellaceae bacterium Pebbles2]|nr:hypothetical protein [Pasteurellaceae bacterium Pebbles2]
MISQLDTEGYLWIGGRIGEFRHTKDCNALVPLLYVINWRYSYDMRNIPFTSPISAEQLANELNTARDNLGAYFENEDGDYEIPDEISEEQAEEIEELLDTYDKALERCMFALDIPEIKNCLLEMEE